MEYSQRVERAQALEGIWGQLWYLVVTQVSVKNGREEKRKQETGVQNESVKKRDTQKVKYRGQNKPQRWQQQKFFVDGWQGPQYRYLLITHILRSFL